MKSLQTLVDTSSSALRQLKSLANASMSLCNQYKSAKEALEKHMKDEEANRKKEEDRLKKLQERRMASHGPVDFMWPKKFTVCFIFNMYLC